MFRGATLRRKVYAYAEKLGEARFFIFQGCFVRVAFLVGRPGMEQEALALDGESFAEAG